MRFSSTRSWKRWLLATEVTELSEWLREMVAFS